MDFFEFLSLIGDIFGKHFKKSTEIVHFERCDDDSILENTLLHRLHLD